MAAGRTSAPVADSCGFSADPQLQRSVMRRTDTFADEFRQCRIGNMSVSDVADSGYIYDRTARVLQCVWCGATVTEWQNVDSISVIQQLHNNSCPRGPPVDEFEPPAAVEASARSEDQVEGSGEYEIDLTSRSPVSVDALKRDNERMREQRMCKRCGRSQVETLFLPCRHLVACEVCADAVEDCFVCDTKILGTVRTYML